MAAGVLFSLVSSTPAMAVAAVNPVLGSFDSAAPSANVYAGCVASVLTGSGFVFGSQASEAATLGAIWPNLPTAVASGCKQAIDTRQPQVCVAPTSPTPCSGMGTTAVTDLLAKAAAIPGNWKLVNDGLGCCGGYAETSLLAPAPGTPMATVTGTFSMPKDYCPSSWCASKPGLWASCDVFGCSPVTNMSLDFTGRTPGNEPSVRSHYYTKDGYGHPVYDIEGIYGQSYWGGGCQTGAPYECLMSPSMVWNCLNPDGSRPLAGTAPETLALVCSGQTITVSMVFLSGPGGCLGCQSVSPTVAQQVTIHLASNLLAWRANPAVCPATDCLRFDDSRLTYQDGAGNVSSVWVSSTPVPAAVVDLASANLSCLVGVNVAVASPSCLAASGTAGPVVQAPQAPVVAPPPTVSASATPLPGSSGYARGPVAVTITGSSAGAGIASLTYSATGAQPLATTTSTGSSALVTVNADGETDLAYFATDTAGVASATQRLAVRVDSSGPQITCAAPAPGWHLDNIAVACTATDALSGLADTAQAAFTLHTNVAAGSETTAATTDSLTVCDRAGNCSTAGPLTGIQIDRAAPSISIRTPAGSYTAGQVALADYTCSDAGSGVAACVGPVPTGAPIDTVAVGVHTFTVTASDAVGNQSQAVMNYTVTAPLTCGESEQSAGIAHCHVDNEATEPHPESHPAHAGGSADKNTKKKEGHGGSSGQDD